MSESFLYLWYDALKNMFYLGKHKGSPADKYTHSSTVWESFTKNNIPEGVTREILAYGTDEEMCILEHKLLVEAKNGGDWDRYYNKSLGDPRYVDQSGKNNPMYGRTGENNPMWGRTGENHPWHGRKHTPETLEKMSGENHPFHGRKHTPETLEKMSESNSGQSNPMSRTNRERRAKKKAATQGTGTLDKFLMEGDD
jgi:hypothetical protein